MSYERLIIDRLERKCDVLFSCNYTDKQKGWEMREKKIKITPENAPVTPDKEIKIIADADSCHGIDAIHNTAIIGDKSRWAYVTMDTDAFFSVISGLIKQLKRRDHELNTICEALEIECLRHVETGEITCRSYKLIRKERECEKYEQVLNEIKLYCETAKGVATNKNNINFLQMIVDVINKAKDGKNE